MTMLLSGNQYLSSFLKKDIMLINLSNWSLTTIIGNDSANYLQSQVTINIDKLKKNNHELCSHCNINGKVLSNLRLFRINKNHYMYIQRKSISCHQVAALKKYAIFSNVNIFNDDTVNLLGITGITAKEKLKKYFNKLPNKKFPVRHYNDIILLWFNTPCERFLLIAKKHNPILKKILTLIKVENTDNLWLALDISSKFPIIDQEMSKKFLPQSLNLENLNGIDFNKGCYHGQEMIAKSQFKKLNQYDLYWLITKSNRILHIGEIIESNYDDKWHKIGHILAFAKIDQKTTWIQAVLKKSFKIDNTLRIKNDEESNLYIKK
ncbi:MAG: tRNA-modifying protein YgfZ [Buchnera aphidicola (Kaburagia rhusicola rhusicola)]